MRSSPYSDNNLWLSWSVATVLGTAAGRGLATEIFNISYPSDFGDVWAYLVSLVLSATLAGTGQWFLLRNITHLITASEWISSTITGVMIGTIVPGVLGEWGARALLSGGFLSPIGTAIGGTILGFCQWILLSRCVKRAGWWVLAVALAGIIFQLVEQVNVPIIKPYYVGLLAGSLICGLAIKRLITEPIPEPVPHIEITTVR